MGLGRAGDGVLTHVPGGVEIEAVSLFAWHMFMTLSGSVSLLTHTQFYHLPSTVKCIMTFSTITAVMFLFYIF